MMLEKEWKTLSGKTIKDIASMILSHVKDGDIVHIGTDSQRQRNKQESFVTAIVVLNPGKGGRVFYLREKFRKFNSLREKLVREAWQSVQTALEIEPLLPKNCGITVHLDANPDTRFKSSGSVKELVGMVVGQGYQYEVKPNAWCASHVSEHIVKGRHEGR